uniref:Coiled-coil domain-containing protein n=1 Tax=Ciona savignyi TaxID=51511 RepID=H2ZK18_CIOSA
MERMKKMSDQELAERLQAEEERKARRKESERNSMKAVVEMQDEELARYIHEREMESDMMARRDKHKRKSQKSTRHREEEQRRHREEDQRRHREEDQRRLREEDQRRHREEDQRRHREEDQRRHREEDQRRHREEDQLKNGEDKRTSSQNHSYSASHHRKNVDMKDATRNIPDRSPRQEETTPKSIHTSTPRKQTKAEDAVESPHRRTKSERPRRPPQPSRDHHASARRLSDKSLDSSASQQNHGSTGDARDDKMRPTSDAARHPAVDPDISEDIPYSERFARLAAQESWNYDQ